MGTTDIRWRQRFQNYDKAFRKLKKSVEQEKLNEIERYGFIHCFEFTIDLSWKVMKDYLEEIGFVFKPSPKDTFRQAQESGYITYAQTLIDGLDIRNELSHDYSGEKFEQSEARLRGEIFSALESLYQFFIREGGLGQTNIFNG